MMSFYTLERCNYSRVAHAVGHLCTQVYRDLLKQRTGIENDTDDLTLLYDALKKSQKGWRRIVDNDIEEIKKIRNRIYHLQDSRLLDHQYNTFLQPLKDIMSRMDSWLCTNGKYTEMLKHIETDNMDYERRSRHPHRGNWTLKRVLWGMLLITGLLIAYYWRIYVNIYPSNIKQHDTRSTKKQNVVYGCPNSPCLNGGTYIKTPSGSKCCCNSYFDGQWCEDDIPFDQICEQLNLTKEVDLREDVKNATRMVSQNVLKKPKMKRLMYILILCLASSEQREQRIGIVVEFLTNFRSDKRQYITQTAFKFLYFLFEDHNTADRENMVHNVLKVFGFPELQEFSMIALSRMYDSLRHIHV